MWTGSAGSPNMQLREQARNLDGAGCNFVMRDLVSATVLDPEVPRTCMAGTAEPTPPAPSSSGLAMTLTLKPKISIPPVNGRVSLPHCTQERQYHPCTADSN